MVEPAKNSIWIYLIPLWQVEQVSSTFGRRGVEVSLTSHYAKLISSILQMLIERFQLFVYNKVRVWS